MFPKVVELLLVNESTSCVEENPEVIETVAEERVLLSTSLTVSELLIGAGAPFSV